MATGDQLLHSSASSSTACRQYRKSKTAMEVKDDDRYSTYQIRISVSQGCVRLVNDRRRTYAVSKCSHSVLMEWRRSTAYICDINIHEGREYQLCITAKYAVIPWVDREPDPSRERGEKDSAGAGGTLARWFSVPDTVCTWRVASASNLVSGLYMTYWYRWHVDELIHIHVVSWSQESTRAQSTRSRAYLALMTHNSLNSSDVVYE